MERDEHDGDRLAGMRDKKTGKRIDGEGGGSKDEGTEMDEGRLEDWLRSEEVRRVKEKKTKL